MLLARDSIAPILLATLSLSGCGLVAGSHQNLTLPTATRELGGFELEGVRTHVTAIKSGEHRYPCGPTWGPATSCTDARIIATLHVEGGPEPYAYDPGWIADDRITIAEREEGREGAIDARANERLASLRLRSCVDLTRRHAAYRIEHDDGYDDSRLWTTVSVAHGVLVGHTEMMRAPLPCEEALRLATEFDARMAHDFARGDVGAFRFAATRGVALAEAIDLSLDHPFQLDPAQTSLNQIDDRFLATLTEALARDPALRAHLARRLTAPDAQIPPGIHVGRTLVRWAESLVAALPAADRAPLFESLAALCTEAPGLGRCPAWRWAAALEASATLPGAQRCARVDAITHRLLDSDPADVEARGIAAFHALSGCPQAMPLLTRVLAARGQFATADDSYLFPMCLDAVGTGQMLDRCRSLPTYALLVTDVRCDAGLRARATEAESDASRPWQMAAIAIDRRCGDEAAARELVGRLHALPHWQGDMMPRFLDDSVAAPWRRP